jgi:hypothetical protein
MPSPFPGMDPWLEDSEVFPDLHNSLIYLLREAINSGLPEGYVAMSANRVWVDDESQSEPDVSVFGRNGKNAEPIDLDAKPFTEAGMVAVKGERILEPWEEPYLEIRSGKGKRLVTAIEVVSLANKTPGKGGRMAYQQKQSEYWLSGVNLVEIDLLRKGPHTTSIPRNLLPQLGEFDYHICITPAGEANNYFLTRIRLADRLPQIVIPLDPGVTPIRFQLQPLLDRCYDSGRYAELVNYRLPCVPPLKPEQQAWAEGILRGKGLIE